MSVDAAIVAVGGFLQPLMPAGTQIVRGMDNSAPPPNAPCVVITEVGMPQFTTTRTVLDGNANQMTFSMPKMLNLQIDFYGTDAGTMSNAAVTMLRSVYGVEKIVTGGVKPLYCSDAIQAPLITGEKQYQTRWLCTLSLQYNSSVVVTQQSFVNVGEVVTNPVDVTIPAE